MTRPDDRLYYAGRARREREIAGTCDDTAVALAHLRMADAYEKMARGIPRPLQAARDV